MAATPSTCRKVGNRYDGAALRSLVVGNSTTSTGVAGIGYDMRRARNVFGVQITGLVGTTKVLLQGSNDGVTWKTLGSTAGYTSTAGILVKSTSSTPVQFVRLFGVTLSTGAARSVRGFITPIF